MGNDGGSIPGRADLVRTKKREKKIKADLLARARCSYCSLSKETLRPPVVICRLGNLYNKENLLEAIIEKKMPTCFKHIRTLADVREVKVQSRNSKGNPSASENPSVEESKASKHGDSNRVVSPYFISCPISKEENNGYHSFIANWNCGCVLSLKAFKELNQSSSTQKLCINCLKPYQNGILITY
jgi:hypothetical protein